MSNRTFASQFQLANGEWSYFNDEYAYFEYLTWHKDPAYGSLLRLCPVCLEDVVIFNEKTVCNRCAWSRIWMKELRGYPKSIHCLDCFRVNLAIYRRRLRFMQGTMIKLLVNEKEHEKRWNLCEKHERAGCVLKRAILGGCKSIYTWRVKRVVNRIRIRNILIRLVGRDISRVVLSYWKKRSEIDAL